MFSHDCVTTTCAPRSHDRIVKIPTNLYLATCLTKRHDGATRRTGQGARQEGALSGLAPTSCKTSAAISSLPYRCGHTGARSVTKDTGKCSKGAADFDPSMYKPARTPAPQRDRHEPTAAGAEFIEQCPGPQSYLLAAPQPVS